MLTIGSVLLLTIPLLLLLIDWNRVKGFRRMPRGKGLGFGGSAARGVGAGAGGASSSFSSFSS